MNAAIASFDCTMHYDASSTLASSTCVTGTATTSVASSTAPKYQPVISAGELVNGALLFIIALLIFAQILWKS